MAEYQITSWRELPSLVVARQGDDVTKVSLAPRFQEAIDEAAMRLGDTGSDDYLAGWERSAWTPSDGSPTDVADAVVGELEERWSQQAIDAFLDHAWTDNEGGELMTTLQQLLERSPMMLFDGGMGTLLQERGIAAGEVGERWNLEQPDTIRDIHREYAAAGATILTTNTFGGSRPRLALGDLGDRVLEINQAAATIASAVAREYDVVVAGDIGPTGELLEPLGTMTRAEAEAVFAEQLTGLVAGGIDLVLIETMSDLDETLAAIAAAKSVASGLPIIATLSFDTNLRTMMGVSPTAAVRALAEAGVDAIGANCGRGPSEMEAIAAELANARPDGMLLAAQSNAGLPHAVGDHFEYDKSPADMAAHAIELHKLGIDLIGACCGSTPGHIKAMHAALAAA